MPDLLAWQNIKFTTNWVIVHVAESYWQSRLLAVLCITLGCLLAFISPLLSWPSDITSLQYWQWTGVFAIFPCYQELGQVSSPHMVPLWFPGRTVLINSEIANPESQDKNTSQSQHVFFCANPGHRGCLHGYWICKLFGVVVSQCILWYFTLNFAMNKHQ